MHRRQQRPATLQIVVGIAVLLAVVLVAVVAAIVT